MIAAGAEFGKTSISSHEAVLRETYRGEMATSEEQVKIERQGEESSNFLSFEMTT
jgi:hypothetical protein